MSATRKLIILAEFELTEEEFLDDSFHLVRSAIEEHEIGGNVKHVWLAIREPADRITELRDELIREAERYEP